MLYKLTQAINISLGALLLIFGVIATWAADAYSAELFFGISFIFAYAILLFFSFTCSKINKCNREKIPVPKTLRTTGWIFFALSILSVVYILVCGIAAMAALTQDEAVTAVKQWQFYIAFLVLLFISVITAILSLILFSKLLRRNKLVINEFVNEIGHSA